MRRSEFLAQEYGSLREEVRETKARLFKLAGFGIVGLPSAYSVAKIYEVDVLVLSLPILICTLVLLFLSESRALMRCGKYIRTVLEQEVVGEDGQTVGGWECWLEEHPQHEPDRRLVDKLLAVFFYLLFLFYYVAAVWLAVQLARESYGVVGLAVALGSYIGVGILFVAVLIYSFRYSVSTES